MAPDVMSTAQAGRVLNIDPSLPINEVKNQFRKLARRHHPDKQISKNEFEKQKSCQKMRLIIQAFEVLVPKHQRRERPMAKVVRRAESGRLFSPRNMQGDDDDDFEDVYDYWRTYFDDEEEQGWAMQEAAVELQEVDDDKDAGLKKNLENISGT